MNANTTQKKVFKMMFFEQVFNDDDAGQIVLVVKSGKYFKPYGFYNTISEANQAAGTWVAKGKDLYYKVNRMDAAKVKARSKSAIGGESELVSIRTVTLDLDTDAKGSQYASRAEILAALAKMPVPPTRIVSSDGTDDGGLHVSWTVNAIEDALYMNAVG